jgi:hypothetical protein
VPFYFTHKLETFYRSSRCICSQRHVTAGGEPRSPGVISQAAPQHGRLCACMAPSSIAAGPIAALRILSHLYLRRPRYAIHALLTMPDRTGSMSGTFVSFAG